MKGWKPGSWGPAICLALALSACSEFSPRRSLAPQARPAAVLPDAGAVRSAASAELARYYRVVQNDLLAQGLLRVDGGGPDTPYTADHIVRNFERIAFSYEYKRLSGQSQASEDPVKLSRWATPVRISVDFGDSVPKAIRDSDRPNVTKFARRLGQITGHPVSVTQGGGNFHVIVAGADDRDFVIERLRAALPNISASDIQFVVNLPRNQYCYILAAADAARPNEYTRAIAVIRAEQPDLMRLACIHEEIAQGFGLPNDSPSARPSIFNDDDEFALLTSHDESLLKLLYDPRLKAGMMLEQARETIRVIAGEVTGQAL